MTREEADLLKEKILKDLDFGIPTTYSRYNIKNEEFKLLLSELEEEGKITYEIIKEKLPDGTPSPFYGDPKHIRLIKR